MSGGATTTATSGLRPGVRTQVAAVAVLIALAALAAFALFSSPTTVQVGGPGEVGPGHAAEPAGSGRRGIGRRRTW